MLQCYAEPAQFKFSHIVGKSEHNLTHYLCVIHNIPFAFFLKCFNQLPKTGNMCFYKKQQIAV